MTTETVSADDMESTRMLGARNKAELLRASKRVTQAHAATCLGVHPSTISRDLASLQEQLDLLAALGLQVVPADSMVVDRHEMIALEDMALRYLESRKFQRMAAQG